MVGGGVKLAGGVLVCHAMPLLRYTVARAAYQSGMGAGLGARDEMDICLVG